jgi:predicted ribosomally synthesized peptide with nif11-like leader
MSMEMALSFINKVNYDSTLQSKLAVIAGNVDGLIKVATEAGFNFSPDDWYEAATTAFSPELSEDELELIAGGAGQSGIPAASWVGKFLQPGQDRGAFDAFTPPPAGLG